MLYAAKERGLHPSEVDLGEHIVRVNEAGSVHFTRYKDGRTSPMIDPGMPSKVEYAPGYLKNKAERDKRYADCLSELRTPKKRGFLSWLFDE